jgi:rod shape-determining protein MreC
MLKKFVTTKIFRVVLVLAVCGLLIFFNPAKFFDPVRMIFLDIVSPFQKISYLASLKIENSREFIFSIGQLKKENEDLLRENQKLLAENSKLADTQRQNDILKEQLDLLPRNKYKLESAYVVGQDPNGSGNWLEISKGSDNGIAEGMPVIISEGFLVGKIGEVQSNSAQVILITNPKSLVNVMSSETGAKGIVRGEFGLGIIFDMILQTDTVNVGDAVITSGISNSVPRGIFIGNVQEMKMSPDRLFQQAIVVSPVQFSKLEVVSVIKGAN